VLKLSHRAQVTSDTAVAVNAGPSYDPDEESGSLAFRWLCGRSDGLDCRTAEGALLPTRMTNSSLAGVKLQAVVGDSLCYTFTLSLSKGGRVASSSTTVSAFIINVLFERQGGFGPAGRWTRPLKRRLGAAKGCSSD
jgi:hypothetical protein